MRVGQVENPYKELSSVQPQREDKHRRIAADVLQALMRATLSGTQFRVALSVIENTWEDNKKSNTITVSTMAKDTRLPERTIRRVMRALREAQIIHYQPSDTIIKGSRVNEFLFNKHYDTRRTAPLTDSSAFKERKKETLGDQNQRRIRLTIRQSHTSSRNIWTGELSTSS